MSNLKNARAKAVKITLNDGVEREIKFTLNAMAELEDRYGTIEKAFEALENNSMKAVRCVLWAGLMGNDASLTEQQVGNLIDMQNLQNIVESMNEAFENSMPDEGKSPNVVTPVQVLPAD